MYEVSSRLRPFKGNTSLNEKLVAHWALDDDAPNKHYADSLGRVPGTLISPTHNSEDITVAGLQGGAADFDGTDYIDISSLHDVTSFNWDQPKSVFMLVKRISSINHPLFSTRDAIATDRGLIFMLLSGSKPYILYRDSATNFIRAYANVVLPISTWFLVGFTYDGSGNSTNFFTYINDTRYFNVSAGGSLSDTTTNVVTIANEYFASGYSPFDGCIQQLSVWDKALTQVDVTALYDGGNILPC